MPVGNLLFKSINSTAKGQNGRNSYVLDEGPIRELKNKHELNIEDDDIYGQWENRGNLEAVPIEEFDKTIPFYAQGERNDLPQEEQARWLGDMKFVFPYLHETPLYEYLTNLFQTDPTLFTDETKSSNAWPYEIGGKNYTKRLFNTWENQQAKAQRKSLPHTPDTFRNLYWSIKKGGFSRSSPISVNRFGVIYSGKHRGVLASFFKNNHRLYEKNNPVSILRVLEGNGGIERDFELWNKHREEHERRIEHYFRMQRYLQDGIKYWWNRTPINIDRDDQQPRLGNLFFH
jgi:hypothetical protein